MKNALPLALLLAGCAVGPNYRPPAAPLPTSYPDAAAIVPAAGDNWWAGFRDPLLAEFVAQAVERNTDVARALARIDQARALARSAGADLLPRLDADAGVETASQSLNTPIGAASNRLGFARGYTQYEAGARAAWEIDLAGGIRRRREAARAEMVATLADAEAVRIMVAAETADAYVALRALQTRLAVARDEEVQAARLADLVRQRVAQGLAPEREGNRTIAELERVRATLPPLGAGIAAQMNRLDVLLGQPAGANRSRLSVEAAIPIAPAPAGSSVPDDLLRRRPDVVAAERRVAAANARIGAAMAEYYPHLSLSALLGVASLGTANLFNGNSVQASAGAGLRWRLFDFGRVDAEVAQARGAEAEALAAWRGTLLSATEDVSTSLSRLVEAHRTNAALGRQVTALAKARDQAKAGYEAGLLALLEVIDADRALLSARDALAAAQAEEARAAIAAYRALGGGWNGDPVAVLAEQDAPADTASIVK